MLIQGTAQRNTWVYRVNELKRHQRKFVASAQGGHLGTAGNRSLPPYPPAVGDLATFLASFTRHVIKLVGKPLDEA